MKNAWILTLCIAGNAWAGPATLDQIDRRELQKMWHAAAGVGADFTDFGTPEPIQPALITADEWVKSINSAASARDRFAALVQVSEANVLTIGQMSRVLPRLDTECVRWKSAEGKAVCAESVDYQRQALEIIISWEKLTSNDILNYLLPSLRAENRAFALQQWTKAQPKEKASAGSQSKDTGNEFESEKSLKSLPERDDREERMRRFPPRNDY